LYDELCGLLRGGRGRLEGVYGIDMLAEEAGVCDNEGAALSVAWDVEARL